MKIYDVKGQERDMTWLRSVFGDVEIHEANTSDGNNVFRLTELRESIGPSSVVIAVKDLAGLPMKGEPVIRYWPGAPELPQWSPPPERWKSRGIVGRTGDGGDVGFGMGQGDYYQPDREQGASGIWLGKPSTHSDFVMGLGMVWATDHQHLNMTFQLMEADDPGPGPTPSPSPPPEEGGDYYLMIPVTLVKR